MSYETEEPLAPISEPPRRKPKILTIGLLGVLAGIAGNQPIGAPGPFTLQPDMLTPNGRRRRRSSAYRERHDPDRPKTPEDLERMEAARMRREKKADKKELQNARRKP